MNTKLLIRMTIVVWSALHVGTSVALSKKSPAPPFEEHPVRESGEWAVSIRHGGIEASKEQVHLRVEFRGEDIVRVRRTALPTWSDPLIPAVLPGGPNPRYTVKQTADHAILLTRKLQVAFDKRSGLLAIAAASGKPLLTESDFKITAVNFAGAAANRIAQSWDFQDGASLYGFGNVMADRIELRGERREGRIDNIVDPVGFVISTAGWGLLWNVAAQFEWRLVPHTMTFETKTGTEEDYFVIAVSRIDDAIRGYRRLTGAASLPPKWVLGYVQSKERYKTQQELVEVGNRFRAERFPCDVIIQDWRYWGDYGWGALAYDPTRYPDPAAANRRLHELGFHTMLSFWHQFIDGPLGNVLFRELKKEGLLYSGQRTYCDAFSPRLRGILEPPLKAFFWSKGWDGWWLDSTDLEPESGVLPTDHTAVGPLGLVWNAYPLVACQRYYDMEHDARPEQRVAILTRRLYPGIQRTGTTFWSGDTDATWETLHGQIVAGLNTSLSGIPYWTTDSGGFYHTQYPAGSNSEDYRELYIRWFQFSSFCAMFRAHGTGQPREPWEFGTATYDVLRRFTNLRYRLMPYIYTAAWRTTASDDTIVRPLVMDFPEDPAARTCSDEFLFGPSMLVCPLFKSLQSRWSLLPSTSLEDDTGAPGGLTVTYFKQGNMREVAETRKEETVVLGQWVFPKGGNLPLPFVRLRQVPSHPGWQDRSRGPARACPGRDLSRCQIAGPFQSANFG